MENKNKNKLKKNKKIKYFEKMPKKDKDGIEDIILSLTKSIPPEELPF